MLESLPFPKKTKLKKGGKKEGDLCPPPFLDLPLHFLDLLPLLFLDLPLPFLNLPLPFLDQPLPYPPASVSSTSSSSSIQEVLPLPSGAASLPFSLAFFPPPFPLLLSLPSLDLLPLPSASSDLTILVPPGLSSTSSHCPWRVTSSHCLSSTSSHCLSLTFHCFSSTPRCLSP